MRRKCEKRSSRKFTPAQRTYKKTVNTVIRFLAAEATQIAVKNRAEIAKEWLLWEVAGLVAEKFGASRKVKGLLKDPALAYAKPRKLQEDLGDNY